MVKNVLGDLFEAKEDILAHGCNCRGGYGAGVAAGMARKYPKARYYYLDKYDEDGWRLGEVQFVRQWNDKTVANCATQLDYKPTFENHVRKVHVDYDAIRTCMSKVKDYAKDKSLSIAIPKIGAGLAGGDWSKINSILEEVFSDYDVTVYSLE